MALPIQETQGYYSLSKNKNIKILFQDTISREWAFSYHSLYTLANCIILIYDITDNQSFLEINIFLGNVNKFCKDFEKVILLGNKADNETDREVTFDDGKMFSQIYGFPFMEVSCAENYNISEAVEIAIGIGLKNKEERNINLNKKANLKLKHRKTV